MADYGSTVYNKPFLLYGSGQGQGPWCILLLMIFCAY